jgi:excinuclease ABC subunit C
MRLNIARQILDNKYDEAIKLLDDEIKISNANFNFERSAHLVTYQQHLQAIMKVLTALEKTKFTNLPNFVEKFTKANLEHADQDTSNIQLLSDLKKRLGLKKIPYKIDCFDISHMQSQSMVGSCVRFLNGKPDKKNFRRFDIKSITQQNDYAALIEIVSRRYKKSENFPDLIIIDGGKGQLNATKHLAGPAEIMSIAKGDNRKVGAETFFFPDDNKTIGADIHQAADRLILEIRDYAHHFAITFHRKKQELKSS